MPLSQILSFPPRSGRVHEASGPSAVSFALSAAAEMRAEVLWVQENWILQELNPTGFDGFDPTRLILVRTKNQDDTLVVAEEALRDGVLSLVVLETTAPISLTAGRRLQLAAKAGGATGLCLIPEQMGSNASETRWHCEPVFDPKDSTLQRWTLKKNKTGTFGAWYVRWDRKARRIAMVSPARERPDSSGAPG